MLSTKYKTLCACLLVAAGAGCSHMIESRAIDRFASSLRNEDVKQLQSATSEQFSQRALRTATALEDIKILRLPDGKTTIVEVETLSPTHRRVTVQVGEGKDKSAKREVFYELVVDDHGKWVVDDVYLKQKKQGVTSYKSVTEQLDLLVTVREFLDGWDAGDRQQVLKVSAPELRKDLENLPPSYLADLTRKVLGGRSLTKTYRPQAQLDETTAVVRLPRSGGETVVTLERRNEVWQVTDIAVDARAEEDQVPSVHKLAIAVNTCVRFLQAYGDQNKSALEPICDPDFFEGSLSIANLKQVVLPTADLAEHQLEVKLTGQRADFLLRGEGELVQIDMRREEAIEPKAAPKFLVSDVTIYERESKQEKRLSALFTAQGMLDLFCEALAARDLDHLRHCSTQDFSNRVWRRLNSATMQGLPLEMFDRPDLEIESMRFQGALTKVNVVQNGAPLVYLLREESGRFFVDDIQWQVGGRPSSVKRTLALLVPVQNFSAAIVLGRDPAQQKMVLQMLQETCSVDFNRMVWQQADFVPNAGLSAETFLNAPLKSIIESESEVLIQFGDDRFGAQVKLRKEHQREVIEDLLLVGGPEPADRVAFKQTMRTLLSTGQAVRPGGNPTQFAARPGTGRETQKIQTAVYEEFDDEPPREILRTGDVIDITPTPPTEQAIPKPPRRLSP